MNVEVIKGDITKLKVDIIVNAANKSLLGGGGVDGAIHKAAGPMLLEECKTLNGCAVGEAKITESYNLPCKQIIHTVGPIYGGWEKEPEKLLKNCYINSMKLAERYRTDNEMNNITIAFPCISTGIYHFPREQACNIAVETIKEINNENIHVIFCCFLDEDYNLYKKKLGEENV
jgi:O-acetyl-ADP-ribose deacetylase (regulator of RNase III)